jgi:hypothetical protein
MKAIMNQRFTHIAPAFRISALGLGIGLAMTACASASPSGASPAASTKQPTAPSSAVATSASPSAAVTGASGTGRLTAAISSVAADPALIFGGQPLTFTVRLQNGSGSTYRDISPLVSIGHCSCSTSGAELAPRGTLAELDSSTGTWHPVAYVTEGTGTDFLQGTPQQPPLTVAPGATASFTFKLALAPLADQSPTERAGQTSVDVTIVTVPSHKQIGTSPAATLPVTVTKAASSVLPGVVADCTTAPPHGLTARPTEIVISCADAGLGVGHLTWSSWTASSATGQGSLWLNLCTPDCADGTYAHYPVKTALSHVKDSSDGPWFSVLTITFEGTRPHSLPGTYNLMPPQAR